MAHNSNLLLAQVKLLTCSLETLKAEHGINYRFASDNKRKFSLNYDMLDAKDSDPVASQCRGVVLYRNDMSPDFDGNTVAGPTTLVARTMHRFFNYGQGSAAEVDFEAKGTRFFEKLDGTMIAFYFDLQKSQWCVATRSVPEADLPMDGFGVHTFTSLFKLSVSDTTGKDYETWVREELLDMSKTYIFELCAPENQVVIKHAERKVWLLAVLDTARGVEDTVTTNPLKYVESCPSYELANFHDMMAFVTSRAGHEHEGLVVCDAMFNRVKVKNAEYLALSRINDSACKSPRALLEFCLSGKLDDALPLLSVTVQEKAQELKAGLSELFVSVDVAYDAVWLRANDMVIENNWDMSKDLRKALAISANQSKVVSVAYAMARYLGKCDSMRSFVEAHKQEDGSYSKTILDNLLEQVGF